MSGAGRCSIAKRQMLRLTDIAARRFESKRAFGLLGAAARAAGPYLEPRSPRARRRPAAVRGQCAPQRGIGARRSFRAGGEACAIDAAIKDLRLVDIAFDAEDAARDRGATGSAQVSG